MHEEPTYNPESPLGKLTICYKHKLENCAGMTVVGLIIEYPPNGATPPHRHGGAAVSAYVLRGAILNKMNEDPIELIEQGDLWHEPPGCHHRISANASQTEAASFFVTIVIETDKLGREGVSVLLQYDEEYKDIVARKMQGLK
ncbi:hypothetical protein N7539_003297 [Penicillium diatomitis]|uniref:Cupin type-2 domain-containing protein n=1 Tax=Penicillium diatomitis TaxID=2819901 RepID=A0A9W9XGA7_9EURO|nr:uncharacterized protein N7539_003297 [Penicillium diatomitis]KAJ5491730.1 hypothetical protein N7539_003297 [Penicillium diatomitis]